MRTRLKVINLFSLILPFIILIDNQLLISAFLLQKLHLPLSSLSLSSLSLLPSSSNNISNENINSYKLKHISYNRHTHYKTTACSSSSSSSSSTDNNNNNDTNTYTNSIHHVTNEIPTKGGEVVGHKGRIGSFLLRSNPNCKPIPKDIQPGTLSPINTPIFVSVPATQVTSVIDMTIPNRRQDLVFITNGIPSDFINHFYKVTTNNDDNDNENNNNNNNDNDKQQIDMNHNNNIITTSVPHFGVLTVGGNVISDKSYSPPTFVYGKHAQIVKDVLGRYDLNIQIVSSMIDIDAAAIRKLIWVSAMWLLCHDVGGSDGDSDSNGDTKPPSPINVTQVHELKQNELFELVRDELYPAAMALLEQYHHGDNMNIAESDMFGSTHTSTDNHNDNGTVSSASASASTSDSAASVTTPTDNIVLGSLEEVMHYLKSYSLSMPGAIPNKVLAIDEIQQRNCILLSMSTLVPQPLHMALIKRVTNNQDFDKDLDFQNKN